MDPPTLKDALDMTAVNEMLFLPPVPAPGLPPDSRVHPSALYMAQERQGRDLPQGLEEHPAMAVMRRWGRDHGIAWSRHAILGPIYDEVRVARRCGEEEAWETPLDAVTAILRGEEDDPYRPAKEFLGLDGADTYKALRATLKRHPQIRTRKPSPQRLEIHAGDWLAVTSAGDAAAFHALDASPERVEAFLAGARQRREWARQRKEAGK
jgi:hypothetical protein